MTFENVPPELLDFITFAKKVAHSNGDLMRQNESLPESKLPEGIYLNEFVSNEINTNIAELIREHYPTHSMYRKGGSLDEHMGYEWICDPLDGAFCYSVGYRVSVTSITLTKDGESIASAVYDPWNDRMYAAVRGYGAAMNDMPISVNNSPLQKYTMVNSEWWPAAAFDIDAPLHDVAVDTGIYLVHQGSVIHSACLVASGIFAASLFGGFVQGKNHEVAAAKLIVEEAGGQISDLAGAPIGFIGDIKGFIISNNTIHANLVERIGKKLVESNDR